ncbi:hypothetical protein Q0Z83_003590 [Actinoplanes sichuanensis]|uniref:AMP-binding protein n=1 Tax=Actinoplanes sichuanensis TaxID=512349 RepID=A0ABW4AI43_9ACTN|nr:AMP-binding protein [Actinoplanes sichuanensis]BEL02168.1 hypothetical protein Q0Z83_003590 [Actinoplanes sichuanensis]
MGASAVLAEFLAAAREHAGRVAIRDNGVEISYAELAGRVIRYAARPVGGGVHTRHDADTVVALFGTWAAGRTWCPVDPGFPAGRQATMARVAAEHDHPSTAYLLFTSGSTGEPKPVATSHRAIGSTVPSLRVLFDLSPDDRVLQFASLNWDTCFEEILPALTGGACLVFEADAHSGSFPRFLRMVARERISVLDLPTAFWHELVGHLRESGSELPDCVRLTIIGGEAAAPAKVALWPVVGGRARLLNTYGCTETTLITHAVELYGTEDPVPIGRPLPHVIERLDDAELLIGGPALADGYPGHPSVTAQRFVTIGGERFFRTGDRVLTATDGVRTHHGRVDREIKIRGIRVDPAEVEAHLTGHPAVRAAFVTGVTVAGRTALTAFVVAGRGETDLPARITTHLRGLVPAHLVPSRIRVVDELAYTASGKVDRRLSEEMHR